MRRKKLHNSLVDSTTSAAIAPPTSRGQAPRAEAFPQVVSLPAAALRPSALSALPSLTPRTQEVFYKRAIADKTEHAANNNIRLWTTLYGTAHQVSLGRKTCTAVTFSITLMY